MQERIRREHWGVLLEVDENGMVTYPEKFRGRRFGE
jgi:hypothetical protein